MRKLTYKDSIQKKKVRDFLFNVYSNKNLTKVIGLGGPDINDYLSDLKSRGYEDIVVYENDPSTLFSQLQNVRDPIEIRYGDIYNSELRDDVLYDLDYCATIKFMKEHLKKFKKNFIMTFSLRMNEQQTISKFFRTRKESIISVAQHFAPHFPVSHSIYKTTGGEYIYIKYFDTSTMCCFAKIN